MFHVAPDYKNDGIFLYCCIKTNCKQAQSGMTGIAQSNISRFYRQMV